MKTLTITLTSRLVYKFQKRLVFPITDVIPDLPAHIEASDYRIQKMVTKIVTEGFSVDNTANRLLVIAPSQIQKVEINF
jgi:hypothetical protein